MLPFARFVFCGLALALVVFAAPAWSADGATTRSTNIALSRSGTDLYVVNRVADSVTRFRVTGEGLQKLFEIGVGRDPFCVAVRRANQAFVTNAADGTVSVVVGATTIRTIAVGSEPRGCALTPDGRRLYVANQTGGTLSVIDTDSLTVIDTIPVGGRPAALAIARNRVFVTQFFARLIPNGPGEGFDDGREGIVQSFPIGNPSLLSETTLSPLDNSGFTANRALFCKQITPQP